MEKFISALAVVIAFLAIIAVMALFWGWLVMVVLGWFGVTVTLFQGWVIAFLISGLTSSNTSSK